MFEYHVLTIGRFSRNRFWGELESRAYRDALCTSTLIKGKMNMVADPSLPPDQMAKTLYDRSGLRPDAVAAVFITHAHGDHYAGLELFEHARWFMSGIDLAAMRKSDNPRSRELAGKIQPFEPGALDGLEFVPLPGHTAGSAGLLFQSEDGRVMVAGDAVMTRDFFRHRAAYYNAADKEQNRDSIVRIAETADIVVPGHGNYFIARNISSTALPSASGSSTPSSLA
ncbi:MAG: MBL fold metallo-hydrolase [Treponema sp.]|jgi:glyoxylase-like metal-dependent hydrolase (beta-lactamase superfamily II)|nr:MBL fold metallo-hydrolase [Treponema sp.]